MLRLGRLQLDVGQGPEDVRSGHGAAEWRWKQLGSLDGYTGVDFGGDALSVKAWLAYLWDIHVIL